MATAVAWVLNLDADVELGAGGKYELRRSLRLAMKPHVERLASALLGPRDILLDDDCPAGIANGLPGRAFCPTPRALAILERAGASPVPHPGFDVLRRVNSRAFASSLGATLPGAAFVTDLASARTLLHGDPSTGDGWRVKHAFGMAGRSQRVVTPGAVDQRGLEFMQVGIAQGGVQIEPNVPIEVEYAIHGVLAGDRSLALGVVVQQRCNTRGAWIATEPIAPETPVDRVDRIADEARRVAGALSAAGYFGPFGVDAFTYRDRAGDTKLQPRSEINARYCMGFAVGFGRPGDR
jgi:hypothetical protein